MTRAASSPATERAVLTSGAPIDAGDTRRGWRSACTHDIPPKHPTGVVESDTLGRRTVAPFASTFIHDKWVVRSRREETVYA